MRQRHGIGLNEVLEAIAGWGSRHRRAVWVIGGLFAVVIGLQAIYPVDRALPFARLGGEPVGFSSHQEIARKLQADYGKVTVTTKIRGKVTKTELPKTGVVTDNDRILAGVSSYPWYLRILPFSSVLKGALTDQGVVTKTDQTRFMLYASERSKECEVAPKNAGVVVKDGEVQLDPAVDGQTCSRESLSRQLTAQGLTKNGITITIQTTPVKPGRSNQDVQPLLKEARAVAEHVDAAGNFF